MKKLKKVVSLTIGFVGCMLAGLFALQTPANNTVTAETDVVGNTKVMVVQFHPVSTAKCIYTQFWTGAGGSNVGSVDIAHGQTDDTNDALADFAKQVTVVKASDGTKTTMFEYGTLTAQASINLAWTGLATGDKVIIPQGTTLKNDVNGDGVYENAYVFATTSQITVGGTCADHGCATKDANHKCVDGQVHSISLGSCATMDVTAIGILNWTQEDEQIYLQMNGTSLSGANAEVKETDRTSDAIANWAKQMLFATSTDGKSFTYYNYYDYVKEVVPPNVENLEFAIQVQNSINIKFRGFQNEWDTLIIPKGTSLCWDTNGDNVLEYHWVASQTYTFVRWKGTNLETGDGLGTLKFTCQDFKSTGFVCCAAAENATTSADGKCNGWFHQIRTTDNTINVTSAESATATTPTKAVLTLNNAPMEILPAQYAKISVAGWEFNDTPFTSSCWAMLENGYLTIVKQSGEAFEENDVIEIAAGTKFTNTLGSTYTFANKVSVVYKGGVWYSVEYYSITGATFKYETNASDFYMHFTSPDGTVDNGYNMNDGWRADVGGKGYYFEFDDTKAFRQSIRLEDASGNPLAINSCQVQGYTDGLYLSSLGQFTSGVKVIIPAGTVFFGTVFRDGTKQPDGLDLGAGVKAVFWKFPQTITMENGATVAKTYLPSAVETTGNNVFVGYKLISKTDGSVVQKLYQAGEEYDATTYNFEAVTVETYMEKGASLRLSDTADQSGIRWTVYVNKAQLENIKNTFGATLNLGVRVRLVNAQGQVSKTESAKTCITDIFGTSTGNYTDDGTYIVYHMAYVMNDSFITLETQNNYKWLGDGFVEVVNSDNTIVKAYAVQNDNARSYKAMVDYFLNHSCTTTATEVNTFEITRTLADGTTEIRYYSFWGTAYRILVNEAGRVGVEVEATDDTTYRNGL